MSMLAPIRPNAAPDQREQMFSTVLRWMIASIIFALIGWGLIGCEEEARAQESFLQEPAGFLPDPNTITLAWNMAAGSEGSIIRAGIATRQYLASWDAGTNQQLTIKRPMGGFTWFFVAVDYEFNYVHAGTNNVKRYRDSAPSNEIGQTSPCPQGEPQLLVTNGVWVVACLCAKGGTLQGSHDLVNWYSIGSIPFNALTYFQGPVAANQFFRIKTT